MAKATLIIEDGDTEGEVKASVTFDPILEDLDENFSLAQYLGILCIAGIKDGSLARNDGCEFTIKG